jgi:pyrroloquinoline quinone (PQQ) biosynthesis protein C
VHFTRNRRDCWAYTQAIAPMDVKRLVWEHEEDELAGSRSRGVADHYTLQVQQGQLFGLTAEDLAEAPMHPGTRTCTYAWSNLVKSGPWQKSIAACAALEIGNSADWVKGGGLSYRTGKKLEADLGIPFKKQVNATEHAEVDVEHGHMLMKIAEAHGSPADLQLMMEGLIESWEIDRIWRGVSASMLEAV